MAVIKVQKAPPKPAPPLEDLLGIFCYKFQQYTFAEAKRLPLRRIVRLLKIAQKEDAKKLLNLTQVVAAPHTKNGSGVKKMIEQFDAIINS